MARPALIALGILLLAAILGWGVAIERSSRVRAREEALAAAEARGRTAQQRAAELEGGEAGQARQSLAERKQAIAAAPAAEGAGGRTSR